MPTITREHCDARGRATGRFARPGFAWAAAILAAFALAGASVAAEYRHPAHLPSKSLKAEVKEEPLLRVGDDRHMRILRVALPEKQLKDTRPLSAVVLHVRQADGNDLEVPPSVGMSTTYVGGGWALKLSTNVVLSWAPSFPGAQAGDVYPCYISFEEGPKKWATREFSLKIGGTGRHMRCEKCFSIGMAPKMSAAATTAARRESMGAGAVPGYGPGGAPRGDGGGALAPDPRVRVQDLLDAKDIQGREVQLKDDILIYSLDALPREEGMGQLRAGLAVRVVGEAAPSFVHVRFTTSSGRTYDGAAKIADLVPLYALNVDVSTPRMPLGPDPHRNEWQFNNLPFSLVAQGTAAQTVHLRCTRQDGTVQELPVQGTVASSSAYNYLRGTLTLASRPGDEYLCYAIHNDGQTTWVSQPFGLACGGGVHGGACAECFDFMPQAQVETLLERVVALKKAKGPDAGAPGDVAVPGAGTGVAPGQGAAPPAEIRPGKVVAGKDTPVYSLRALPQEQLLGTLKAGAALYVMEDLGGAFVRARFTTPGGRSGEGAVKKADLGAAAR